MKFLVSTHPTQDIVLLWILKGMCGGGNEGASMVAQMVKNPPAIQETWVRSLGWEDPPEQGKATHSSILAWGIPWAEEPGGYSSWGYKESNVTE